MIIPPKSKQKLYRFIEINRDKGILYIGLLLNDLNLVIKIPIAEFLAKNKSKLEYIKLEFLNYDEFLNQFPII